MASLFKRGKSWYVKYYSNGKPVRKAVCRDKKTAGEYKAHLEVQLARMSFGLPVEKYSWQKFIEKYLAYSKVEKRIRTTVLDSKAIQLFANFAQPQTTGDLNRERLEEWKADRLKEVSPTTVNIELRHLKACFHKAVEWGIMDQRQFAGVKQLKQLKKLPRFLSKEEIKKLSETMPIRWWRMFYTMICTGLRLGEFLHLKWSQINWGRKVIILQSDHEWAPKDNELREIPLHPNLEQMLWQMNKEAGNPRDGYIFHDGNITPTLIRRIERKFQAYRKKAGIEKCRIHDLRHTFASHLVMSGADLLTVRDLLGHSSVKTTEIYAHLSPSHRQQAVERLDFGTQFRTQHTFILPVIASLSSSGLLAQLAEQATLNR